MKQLERYFFDRDDDGHYYLIPEKYREEWARFKEIEDAWELPEWEKFERRRLGGGITNITFENPEVEI